MNLIIQHTKNSDLKEITNLLLDNQLPTADITEDSIQLFVGLIKNEIVGTIGLETYKPIGLLRSLAVKDVYKNHKMGEKLVKHLFDFCISNDMEDLYLLTTTAEKYFSKFGFQKIDRRKVPEVIMQTKEFKDICPVSAVVMHKRLN